MNNIVIQTRGLTRYFGGKCAVDSVSLSVPRGCVFALLGRNGSGKTTLLRMLLGLLEPTRGTGSVLGYDIRSLPPESRGRIGYMAENHPLYGWMRVKEMAQYQASFYPSWNRSLCRAVLDHFHLSDQAKIKSLSRGERAGVALAMTIAPEPELLILDDPALGLDPVARRALLETMVYLTGRGQKTVVFSSHLLGDVERVADRIGILDRSVLRVNCDVDRFRQQVRQWVLRFDRESPPVPAVPGLLFSQHEGRELRLTIANADEQVEQIVRTLGAAEIEDTAISLEDAVIGYLGYRGARGLRVPETGGVV